MPPPARSAEVFLLAVVPYAGNSVFFRTGAYQIFH